MLKNPFPAAPTRKPKHVLYCDHQDGRIYVVNTATTYAAARILRAIVAEDGNPVVVNGNELTCGTIIVRCDELDEVMGHRDNPEEEQWELPKPYPQQIARFVNGRAEVGTDAADAPEATTRKVVKAKRPDAPTGSVSLQDLCVEMKVEPRDARAMLRKGMDKPAAGWVFAGDDLEKARKILGGKKE